VNRPGLPFAAEEQPERSQPAWRAEPRAAERPAPAKSPGAEVKSERLETWEQPGSPGEQSLLESREPEGGDHPIAAG
jgi:hypothetical protein